MDLPISIVELFDLKLVKNTDFDAFQETWGIDLSVCDSLNVTDAVQVTEVEAVGIMLIRSLHQV